jgi:energy-converting hydrogenase A subunit M
VTTEVPDFSLSQLCWLLDITKPRVGQLEEADIVVKAGRDRYAVETPETVIFSQI